MLGRTYVDTSFRWWISASPLGVSLCKRGMLDRYSGGLSFIVAGVFPFVGEIVVTLLRFKSESSSSLGFRANLFGTGATI